MKSTFSRVSLLGIAASLSSAAMFAAPSGEVPLDFRPIRKNTFSFGLNMRSFGANVKFSNLGMNPLGELRSSALGTVYNDGSVSADSKGARGFEDDPRVAAGFTVYTQNGTRYQVFQTRPPIDANGVAGAEQLHLDPVTGLTVFQGERLSYAAGYSRQWRTATTAQIGSDNRVAFSDYGFESEGASAEGKAGSSSGVELGFERVLSKKHDAKLQWNFGGSIGIADINAKSSQQIKATLLKRTDYYRLNGSIDTTGLDLSAPYTSEKFPENGTFKPVTNNGFFIGTDGRFVNKDGNIVNAQGQLLNANSTVVDPTSADPLVRDPVLNDNTANPLRTNPIAIESTVAISSTPDAGSGLTTKTVGGADIDGRWQIKGSYYALKLGPSFRYKFSERFSVSGRAGVTINYIGTRFIVDELVTSTIAGVTGLRSTTDNIESPVSEKAENEVNEITFGGFAGVDLEYWVSDKTGFYAGAAYESLGDFTQEYQGRKAEISGGSGTSFRFGIITRF